MRVKAFRARFRGLYEWGVGWLSEDKRNAWNKFFESINDNFWSYHTRGDSKYLVTTGGSVYLHPMDVKLVCTSEVLSYSVKDGERIEEHMEIEALKKILSGAAEACGGSVEFSEVSVVEIKNPEYERK